jgi:hypothetical protein
VPRARAASKLAPLLRGATAAFACEIGQSLVDVRLLAAEFRSALEPDAGCARVAEPLAVQSADSGSDLRTLGVPVLEFEAAFEQVGERGPLLARFRLGRDFDDRIAVVGVVAERSAVEVVRPFRLFQRARRQAGEGDLCRRAIGPFELAHEPLPGTGSVRISTAAFVGSRCALERVAVVGVL